MRGGIVMEQFLQPVSEMVPVEAEVGSVEKLVLGEEGGVAEGDRPRGEAAGVFSPERPSRMR